MFFHTWQWQLQLQLRDRTLVLTELFIYSIADYSRMQAWVWVKLANPGRIEPRSSGVKRRDQRMTWPTPPPRTPTTRLRNSASWPWVSSDCITQKAYRQSVAKKSVSTFKQRYRLNAQYTDEWFPIICSSCVWARLGPNAVKVNIFDFDSSRERSSELCGGPDSALESWRMPQNWVGVGVQHCQNLAPKP